MALAIGCVGGFLWKVCVLDREKRAIDEFYAEYERRKTEG